MRRSSVVIGGGVALLLTLAVTSAHAKEAQWKDFDSEKFGFKMLVPEKMAMAGLSVGEWGGMRGKLGVVDLYGLARLNHFPDEKVMQAFAVKQTKIPAAMWKLVEDKGAVNGFKWRKAYRAHLGKHLVYVIMGHGEKGAYILYLKTTWASRLLAGKHYIKWYQSVTLY